MANEATVRAVRALEGRLEEALAGETLYGLPNLTPDLRSGKFCGLRVNNGGLRGQAEFVPLDGREVLAINTHGMLVWVRREAEEAVERAVADEEIRADYLAPFTSAVQSALDMHTAKVEQRSEAYARVSDLASRLLSAIGPNFSR